MTLPVPSAELLKQTEDRAAAGDERARRVLPRMREAAGLDPDTGEQPKPKRTKRKPGGLARQTRKRFAFNREGRARLPLACQVVWAVLLDYETNGQSGVSVGKLAKITGMSRSTIDRAVRRLRKDGYLVVLRQGGLSTGTTSYRLVPVPPSVTSDASAVVTGDV